MVSTLGGSGGLERTDFKQCLIWVHVTFLKELILTVSTLAGMVVLKEKILTVSNWVGMVVLKELIFYSFYFGWVWWS